MSQVDKKKQLVFNIITFLRTSESNNSVPEDSLESLQVAQQCLADAFGVDPDSAEDARRYGAGCPDGLEGVWDAYLETQGEKVESKTEPSVPSPAAAQQQPTTTTPSAADKQRAESLKAAGNALISAKQYSTAIEKYSQAIALDPSNAVYYSNRAAAWGAMGEHDEAVKDAERAVELDAGFVRGYSRLGTSTREHRTDGTIKGPQPTGNGSVFQTTMTASIPRLVIALRAMKPDDKKGSKKQEKQVTVVEQNQALEVSGTGDRLSSPFLISSSPILSTTPAASMAGQLSTPTCEPIGSSSAELVNQPVVATGPTSFKRSSPTDAMEPLEKRATCGSGGDEGVVL
ncbi:hypothetical protein QFC20_007774 [Naganishia adeliensis]|uniref:Uncharacterized protein n=1 Tax=Naganishia adeliensis TaxID=92952 RepID=A0ACC2UVT8_9TREE|nr:hypothetical protein QFC20_007774 [Naganishia adeliensis]